MVTAWQKLEGENIILQQQPMMQSEKFVFFQTIFFRLQEEEVRSHYGSEKRKGYSDSRSNGASSTGNGTLKRRVPSYVCVKQNQIVFQNCGALHGLVPFVQFKKREKRPWKSVDFS